MEGHERIVGSFRESSSQFPRRISTSGKGDSTRISFIKRWQRSSKNSNRWQDYKNGRLASHSDEFPLNELVKFTLHDPAKPAVVSTSHTVLFRVETLP